MSCAAVVNVVILISPVCGMAFDDREVPVKIAADPRKFKTEVNSRASPTDSLDVITLSPGTRILGY